MSERFETVFDHRPNQRGVVLSASSDGNDDADPVGRDFVSGLVHSDDVRGANAMVRTRDGNRA